VPSSAEPRSAGPCLHCHAVSGNTEPDHTASCRACLVPGQAEPSRAMSCHVAPAELCRVILGFVPYEIGIILGFIFPWFGRQELRY
jgi:hypothetical protein